MQRRDKNTRKVGCVNFRQVSGRRSSKGQIEVGPHAQGGRLQLEEDQLTLFFIISILDYASFCRSRAMRPRAATQPFRF